MICKAILLAFRSQGVKPLLDKYSDLFEEGSGRIHGMKAHITLQEDAKPVYRKA